MAPPPWIVMVPFPALGHVTPMLHLARTLHALHSFRSVIAVPSFIHRRIHGQDKEGGGGGGGGEDDGVVFASIPDGISRDHPAPDFFAIEEAMENHMPVHLRALLESPVHDGGSGCACVVVDLLATWAMQVARGCGVPVAGFWPAMLATYRILSAIPEMIGSGLISETGIPVDREAKMLAQVLRLQPNLTTHDLPWLVGDKSSQSKRFGFWLKTLGRWRSLPWLLVNSFSEDDDQADAVSDSINGHHYQAAEAPRVTKLAPLLMMTATSLHLWGEEDKGSLEWLSLQKPSSVVYVSFGSWVGPVGEEKVMEMALGLEAAGQPFLWVLGPSWRKGLPTGYLDRVAGRGRVVGWAPQVDVLQHEAVGCHLTHCGWNSTLESIRCGKKLLCFPIAGDQFVNCAYIVSVWKIGIRLGALERGAVVECVRRLMDDGEGMGRGVCELRDAISGDGGRGRARSCLQSFVNDLKRKKKKKKKKTTSCVIESKEKASEEKQKPFGRSL